MFITVRLTEAIIYAELFSASANQSSYYFHQRHCLSLDLALYSSRDLYTRREYSAARFIRELCISCVMHEMIGTSSVACILYSLHWRLRYTAPLTINIFMVNK